MKFGRFTGPALVAGGSLWSAMYVLELVIGPLRPGGIDPTASSLEWLAAVCFGGAIVSIGFGLIGLRQDFGGRARKLGIAACVPAAFAMCPTKARGVPRG